jgi:hypothetical protein
VHAWWKRLRKKSAARAVHVVTHVRVTVPTVRLPAVPALRAARLEPTRLLLMAATSLPKQLVPHQLPKPHKPPLSASAKPRQLQQLTVPRPSNRSE